MIIINLFQLYVLSLQGKNLMGLCWATCILRSDKIAVTKVLK